jgi:hypothetical protein
MLMSRNEETMLVVSYADLQVPSPLTTRDPQNTDHPHHRHHFILIFTSSPPSPSTFTSY